MAQMSLSSSAPFQAGMTGYTPKEIRRNRSLISEPG